MSNHLSVDLIQRQFFRDIARVLRRENMDVQNILSTIDLAELRNHIIQTSIVAWKNYITESSLDRWLKNFDGAALGNALV